MKSVAIAGVFVATMLASSSAQAVNLWTAPSQDVAQLKTFCCDLVNIGTKPINVVLEARQYDGTVVFSVPKTLQAGQGDSACDISGTAAYCHFTSSSRLVRAVAVHQFDSSRSYIEAH